MKNEFSELFLEQSYSFDVKIDDNGNHFIGYLELTPKAITLTINGDEICERKSSLYFDKQISNKQVMVIAKNCVFELYNLQCIRSQNLRLNEKVGSFKYVFNVEYAVFYECRDFRSENSFRDISIYSEMLEKWLGFTPVKEQLLNDYHLKKDSENNLESRVNINDQGYLFISYDWISHYHSISTGLNCPAKITYQSISVLNGESIFKTYNRIVNYLSITFGNDFIPSKLKLNYDATSILYTKSAYLYIPTNSKPKSIEGNPILFPSGLDKFNYDLGLPEFPMESFNTYLSLDHNTLNKFSKYLKYKKMNVLEDKFLGYFRLLESLCLENNYYFNEQEVINKKQEIQDFLENIFGDGSRKAAKSFAASFKRFNSQKSSTGGNISKYFKLIPKELSTQWNLPDKYVDNICLARNNITHANDYTISDDELTQYIKFSEVLLVIKLLELAGIEIEISSKIISRLSGYHQIKFREETPC